MKKTLVWLTCILLLAALLAGCGGQTPAQTTAPVQSPEESTTEESKEAEMTPEAKAAREAAAAVTSESLYVKPVTNLPEDFILGMDVSSVLAEEKSGVRYFDAAGQEKDLLQILAENGITHIRVRVWNHPFDQEGRGFGGGNCDIAAAAEIGKRAAKYGLPLIVDFHYSDFWADPGKQMAPAAWENMKLEEKTEAAYQYTKESLEVLRGAGCLVGMVQLGNETNGALAGENTWYGIQSLMQAGAKAVRETFPEALVAVHFANPENEGSYATYAKKLDYYHVDYDVFASSYYPFWHGTLDNLKTVLDDITRTYGKKTMVMETSYAFTDRDTDFSGNTIGDGGGIVKDYPFTVQGQANHVRNVAQAVADMEAGIGICYWEGAWITVGTSSWEENHEKWEKYGSGWASSYAAVYDPKDAGKYYGGSAVDNQALFDWDGKPLESLKVFALLRKGNETAAVPDAIADVQLTVDLNDKVVLPETVDAVMTDDSRSPVPVKWAVTEEELAAMNTGGPAMYTVHGDAGGLPAVCHVDMIEFNFLQNAGFETGDLTGWEVTDLGKTEQLYVEDKVTDSNEGTCHMHFWSPGENTVEFTLEQTVTGLKAGKYKFTISIMGGDGGNTEIYAYAKADGEMLPQKAPLEITGYDQWHTGRVEGIEIAEGQTVTVGVYVRCAGAGNGAWGKIDRAMLNSQ